jgi:uncharacterized protein
MSPVDAVLILLAGVGAGVMNAVVGAGTLITFPTLLLLGYPPLLANMSNAVGLIPGSIAGAYGYRATLVGRGRIVRRLMLATASGGLLGALLLVLLPAGTFEAVIPTLLIASAILAAFQPRIAGRVALRRARRSSAPAVTAATTPAAGVSEAPIAERLTPAIVFAVFGTGIYGGYFGAAQGVILLVVLGVALGGAMNSLNGIKNVLSGVANFVSATLFVFIGEIDWAVAGLVAIGATVGGGLGGRYGRRLPANALRGLVVLVAVIAAVSRLIT